MSRVRPATRRPAVSSTSAAPSQSEIHLAGAGADAFGFAAELVGYGDPDVPDRRLRGILNVAMSLARNATHQYQRQRIRRVDVAVTHAAAIGDERVVEEVAVAI